MFTLGAILCESIMDTIINVKVGDCYIRTIKYEDPFIENDIDILRILNVENGYVQYIQGSGFIGSTKVKYFRYDDIVLIDSCL